VLSRLQAVSQSASRREGPASYGRAGSWPQGPFPRAKDPGTRQAVSLAAEMAIAIRSTRAALGWSQSDLAEQAGVNRGTVSRMESGASWVDLYVVARLAAALDLRIGVERPHR